MQWLWIPLARCGLDRLWTAVHQHPPGRHPRLWPRQEAWDPLLLSLNELNHEQKQETRKGRRQFAVLALQEERRRLGSHPAAVFCSQLDLRRARKPLCLSLLTCQMGVVPPLTAAGAREHGPRSRLDGAWPVASALPLERPPPASAQLSFCFLKLFGVRRQSPLQELFDRFLSVGVLDKSELDQRTCHQPDTGQCDE